jgi:hypothetical protein
MQTQSHEFIFGYTYKIVIFLFYDQMFHLLFATSVVGDLSFDVRLIFSHTCRLQLKSNCK